MTIKKRLHRSNIYMFLIPLVTAALLLILGAGIAIYILEVKYLPRIGLSLYDLHIAVEQNEDLFQGFETFVWIYVGAVGMALLLTIVFTNVNLTRELFTHISEPLDTLVGGVDRIRSGDLDNPINYTEPDEFKAACDAVDLMAAKLKASLEAEQRRQQSSKELMAGMGHDLKSPLTSIRAYTEALLEGVADILRRDPAKSARVRRDKAIAALRSPWMHALLERMKIEGAYSAYYLPCRWHSTRLIWALAEAKRTGSPLYGKLDWAGYYLLRGKMRRD